MAGQKNEMADVKALPEHVAIIMDGNGRWARKRLLPRYLGHRAGMEALKKTVEACREIGIPYLTVFAFSTENWKRPRREVEYLMRLLVEYIDKELAELKQQGIKVQVLGDTSALEESARDAILRACEDTRGNTGMVLSIALNYGSRAEIARAARMMLQEALAGALRPEDIDEEMIGRFLYTSGMPDPDLMIRTAGECRISNFMLWQAAYSELYVTATLWPDFDRQELTRALREYEKRERRFGGLTASGDE